MAKLTKKRKALLSKFDSKKTYSLNEATKLLKDLKITKFDPTVELYINLGIDMKKTDQLVRGTVSLPHGIGKKIRVLAICNPDDVEKAIMNGADYAGLEEYLDKIKGGWTDIDVIITHPSLMGKLGPLGKVLGPKGLMPNPKSGTVATDVPKAVAEFKAGKIDYRVDKAGTIHVGIGKLSFEPVKIEENFKEIYQQILKSKPNSLKGNYVNSVFLSATMSPSLNIDINSII